MSTFGIPSVSNYPTCKNLKYNQITSVCQRLIIAQETNCFIGGVLSSFTRTEEVVTRVDVGLLGATGLPVVAIQVQGYPFAKCPIPLAVIQMGISLYVFSDATGFRREVIEFGELIRK